MARSKKSYAIKVHYPEDDEGMLQLRKRMGAAYIRFVKNHILALPISDEAKNELYTNVLERLNNRS